MRSMHHAWIWLRLRLGRAGHACARGGSLVLVFIPIFGTVLLVSASHAHISPDTYATALLCDHPAQSSAFRQAWELLGTEDLEWLGLHFEPVIHYWSSLTGGLGLLGHLVLVLDILKFLVQAEAQPVVSFVTNR